MKIQELALSPQTVCENPHLPKLLTAIEKGREGGPRIYEMIVRDTRKTFLFRTTSKDTYLELGAFGTEMQYEFARLLEWQFEKMETDSILLYGREKEKGNALLVTNTKHPDGLGEVYTLSPARR